MSEPGTTDAVVLERHGAVALLRLNEPKSMNALSPTIKAGLNRHLPGLLEDNAVRCLLITGTDRAFCAGGDIRAMDERGTIATQARMRSNYNWLLPLLTARKPVITALNGAAAGAGFALALTGDYVLASTEARFRAGFFGIAAVPDLGLAYTLPRAVGMLRAKEILFSNRDVDAEEALRIGLVTRVIAADKLMEEAMKLAEQLAAGPTASYGLAKGLLQRAYNLPLEGFLESEASAQTTAFGSDDIAEGIAAFKGKRKPAFQGK
ncbi:enoyl-CoA hydratase/isomerase family protein [Ferrovibrio sp.]|uniref:enoyl-CoA hydratase/isomerase family protein n=1 Tax=Ferrovibrio sp. TaxID=1917215 RepID=UPI003D2A5F33